MSNRVLSVGGQFPEAMKTGAIIKGLITAL